MSENTETPRDRAESRRTTTTYVGSRPTIRIVMPDGWARALLTGVEAALGGWAFVLVCSALAYASVASNPWMGSTTWEGALSAGADLWAASLGAPVVVGGVSYRAIPTLLVLLLIGILRLFMRAGATFPPAAQWFAVPGFAVASLLVVGLGASRAHWWEALPGALAIPTAAALWAVVDAVERPPAWLPLPGWAREGLRMGGVEALAALVIAVVGAGAAAVAGWERAVGIHELLLTDSALADALAVGAQILFLPTVLAWSLAWITGPGAWAGEGALHSPLASDPGALPALPVLGFLPQSSPGWWVGLIPAIVGVLVGWAWSARRHRETPVDQAKVAAVAAGVLAVVVLVWMSSATMVLGSQRLAVFGPRVGLVVVFAVLEIGVVAGVIACLAHPVTVAAARRRWGALVAAGTRSGRGSGSDGAGESAGSSDEETPTLLADEGPSGTGSHTDAGRQAEAGAQAPTGGGGGLDAGSAEPDSPAPHDSAPAGASSASSSPADGKTRDRAADATTALVPLVSPGGPLSAPESGDAAEPDDGQPEREDDDGSTSGSPRTP
ncbi:DUF6350 family protein [Actinomyces sp. B33]|uniref:cell division protein PerM n=1 Tax=Actinomyces sp. B33 TaxID=2942131 RepID=UPI0023414F93|nr:DUF6350 family protein [Actinomyces sp. B33]MDC4233724.1 DUF6350 family protein [Actinomyces sp. B33]